MGEFDRLLYLFQFHSLLGFAFLLLFDFSIKDGFAKQTASIWFWVLVGFAVAPSSPLLLSPSSGFCVLQAFIGFSLCFFAHSFIFCIRFACILCREKGKILALCICVYCWGVWEQSVARLRIRNVCLGLIYTTAQHFVLRCVLCLF